MNSHFSLFLFGVSYVLLYRLTGMRRVSKQYATSVDNGRKSKISTETVSNRSWGG